MTESDLHHDPRRTARRLAPMLKALADENRLAILLAIADEAKSVVELTEALDLPQTLVSHHLKALRDNAMVTVTPRGRSNVYALCCESLTGPVQQLMQLLTPAGRVPAPTSRENR